MEQEKILVGAHISGAGGLHNALIDGHNIGATTIQLFTSNQRQWNSLPLTTPQIDLWHNKLEETGLEMIMSHDSYLINLGSPKPDLLEKSRLAFREEIQRCQILDIAFLNFHPGSATSSTAEECITRIVESILSMTDLVLAGNTKLLIESTAGQGTTVGYRFEQIAEIVSQVKQHIPIGVCIDTCHSFTAGYDIRTPQGWEETLKAFDNTIGLEHLCAFHINDSQKPFGSRRDRHAPLGEGEIGLSCFQTLMTHPKTKHLPKYLETPGGLNLWEKEIKMLKQFYRKGK